MQRSFVPRHSAVVRVMRFFARLILVMLLSLGLLMPRVSVMLAQLTGAERVLFCNGTTMVVLALDEGGAPQSISHEDPCGVLLVDLPDAAPEFLVSRISAPIRRARLLPNAPALPRLPRRHPPRAPPRR